MIEVKPSLEERLERLEQIIFSNTEVTDEEQELFWELFSQQCLAKQALNFAEERFNDFCEQHPHKSFRFSGRRISRRPWWTTSSHPLEMKMFTSSRRMRRAGHHEMHS